jgi:hypothetical protein
MHFFVDGVVRRSKGVLQRDVILKELEMMIVWLKGE